MAERDYLTARVPDSTSNVRETAIGVCTVRVAIVYLAGFGGSPAANAAARSIQL